jgi:hypothetical protein
MLIGRPHTPALSAPSCVSLRIAKSCSPQDIKMGPYPTARGYNLFEMSDTALGSGSSHALDAYVCRKTLSSEV